MLGLNSRRAAGILNPQADGHLFFFDRLEVSEHFQFHSSLLNHMVDQGVHLGWLLVLHFEVSKLQTVQQIIDDVLHGPHRRFEYLQSLELDLVVEVFQFSLGIFVLRNVLGNTDAAQRLTALTQEDTARAAQPPRMASWKQRFAVRDAVWRCQRPLLR